MKVAFKTTIYGYDTKRVPEYLNALSLFGAKNIKFNQQDGNTFVLYGEFDEHSDMNILEDNNERSESKRSHK